ncbi:MAG TPA: DUF1800 family protein, partial [Verrucomicrobiae bacterium]|nr:DUF1800 family protein [Verrucomicrobiae bacterium]
MNSSRVFVLCLPVIVSLSSPQVLRATDPPPPIIESFTSTGAVKTLQFPPYPAAQAYTFYSATNLSSPFTANSNFVLSPFITGYTVITNNATNVVTVTNYAYEWRYPNATAPSEFYRVGVTPLSSNALLTATVLNRLAYGPTPDELERVASIGPQAYIDEQLNMDGIPETIDNYTFETTNSIVSDPATNWTSLTVTGTMASATGPFYLFTTQPGDMYIDDIELRPFKYFQNIVTNQISGTNVYTTNRVFSHIGTNILINGAFESALSPWTAAGGHLSSAIAAGVAHSGSSSLHVVSTTGGSAPGGSYVRQGFSNSYATTNSNGNPITYTYATTDPVVLTYWYLPSANSSKLRLQLSSGLNSTPGGLAPTPTWVYAKATGTATATPQLYIYLSAPGTCYVDDVKLVAGTVAEAGANLLANGDFESGISPWLRTGNHSNSVISAAVAHSGSGSVQLVSTGAGGSTPNSVYQANIPGLVNGQTYTVSYWYLPSAPASLTVRLSGSLLTSTPDSDTAGLYRRLGTFAQNGIGDYRAWFSLHAVNSPRQLFEVLSQFWENHFVTQYSKSQTYFTDNQGYDGTTAGRLAADWEFREMTKWRNAMLKPQCTFYDLLRISAESPAMIVYLDTVNSKGNGTTVANENYARELLELFTCGVDNGYDQNDIILMSRAWTGWSVELVDAANANNPFAPASLT